MSISSSCLWITEVILFGYSEQTERTDVIKKECPAFSFSGSISLAISSFLISAIVLGPFLSLVPEKPWPDSRSSKLASEALGLEPDRDEDKKQK